MGDMAMAIAHELAQPLAAATNFIAGTQSRLDDGGAGRDEVSWGSGSAQATRPGQSDRAEPARIRDATRGVAADRRSQRHRRRMRVFHRHPGAGQRGSRRVPLGPSPIAVVCERVLTGQVVLNLCFNAIDEMAEWPADERIVTVRTERQRRRASSASRTTARVSPTFPAGESSTARSREVHGTWHRAGAEPPHHHPTGRHDRRAGERSARGRLRIRIAPCRLIPSSWSGTPRSASVPS